MYELGSPYDLCMWAVYIKTHPLTLKCMGLFQKKFKALHTSKFCLLEEAQTLKQIPI